MAPGAGPGAVDLASWEHLGGKSVLSGPPAVQGQRGHLYPIINGVPGHC